MTIWGVVGNSYIHDLFWGHLIPNVIVLVVVTSILLLVLAGLGERRLYYEIFLLDILILPTILSLLWLPVDQAFTKLPPDTLGFSGAVAALEGSTVVSAILAIHRKFKAKVTYGVYAALAFIGVTFAATYQSILGQMGIVLLVLMVVFFALFFVLFRRSARFEASNARMFTVAGSMLIFLMPYLALLIIGIFLFPEQIVIANGVVNVFVHYEGLIIGTLVALLLVDRAMRRKVPIPPNPAAVTA